MDKRSQERLQWLKERAERIKNGDYDNVVLNPLEDLPNESWAILFTEKAENKTYTYYVSNLARVKYKCATRSDRFLKVYITEKLVKQKPMISRSGERHMYACFPLHGRSSHFKYKTAELVALKFLEFFLFNEPYLKFRDGNTLNCQESNLEWSNEFLKGSSIKVSWYNSKARKKVTSTRQTDLTQNEVFLKKLMNNIHKQQKK